MELIMDLNSDFVKYQKAKKQVEEIKGFYVHLMAYGVVMCVLVFINLKYTPEHLWFLYSTSGWGLGLFFHAVKAFNWFPFMSKNWEEKKLQQFMNEEKSKSNKYQ